MSYNKTLQDYNQVDIKKYNEMHLKLTAYNESIGSNYELPVPVYTDDEMAAYSTYRELIIAKECEEE